MLSYKEVLDAVSDIRSRSSIAPSRERILSTERQNLTLTEEGFSQDTTIWGDIMTEYEKERIEVEEYKKKKNPDSALVFNQPPLVDYMENNIFKYLCPALVKTLQRAVDTNSIKGHKSAFNALDHLAQLLWNGNPLYPERQQDDLYIHDMDWAIEYLKENPRPYFPLSWIMTPEYAATKIQAFMHGYWVRRREDVQEMRQFWKVIKDASLHSIPKDESYINPCKC